MAAALEKLALPNVVVSARRAEEVWRDGRADVITARAFAPVARVVGLFGPALKAGTKILLYKGPDAEREIAESAKECAKLRVRAHVVMRYDLPDSLGSRTIIQIQG